MNAVDLSAMRALLDNMPFDLPFNLSLLFQAADEIESLREQLADARNSAEGYAHHVKDITAKLDEALVERAAARAECDQLLARRSPPCSSECDDLVNATEAQARQVSAARDQMRAALAALVEALPGCYYYNSDTASVCWRPATQRDRYDDSLCCDAHVRSNYFDNEPYAPALRAAVALLERLAGRVAEGMR